MHRAKGVAPIIPIIKPHNYPGLQSPRSGLLQPADGPPTAARPPATSQACAHLLRALALPSFHLTISAGTRSPQRRREPPTLPGLLIHLRGLLVTARNLSGLEYWVCVCCSATSPL